MTAYLLDTNIQLRWQRTRDPLYHITQQAVKVLLARGDEVCVTLVPDTPEAERRVGFRTLFARAKKDHKLSYRTRVTTLGKTSFKL